MKKKKNSTCDNAIEILSFVYELVVVVYKQFINVVVTKIQRKLTILV